MKKILGTITVLIIAVIVHAQVSIKGFAEDTLHKPIEGASVFWKLIRRKK